MYLRYQYFDSVPSILQFSYGTVAGPNALDYIANIEKSYTDLDDAMYEKAVQVEQEKFDQLLTMKGTENAYKIHRELGEIMTANVTVVRDNKRESAHRF